MDSACEMRTLPSIRLSVLKPSIIILANEYTIRYTSVICPLYFLLFDIAVNNMNSEKVTIDSYKNVGCTSIYFPASTIPILQGRLVTLPYASIFIKFPHLPIACPIINPGTIMSVNKGNFSFCFFE